MGRRSKVRERRAACCRGEARASESRGTRWSLEGIMRHGFDALVDTLIDLECEQKNNLNFIYLF